MPPRQQDPIIREAQFLFGSLAVSIVIAFVALLYLSA